MLSKTFPSFSLKIANGQVRKGEVVGIVGANALGKTTFMKMLAGVDKPDSGNLQIGAKISYKPQYLNQEYNGSVKSILSIAYENDIEGSLIEEQILAPIGLKKLYEKSVKNLSGGELQKVAVAACLIRNADIYALDEPSAFLDAEDRIALAKFIQRYVRANEKSAIIIDHDVQLIDLMADSLIIFEGYQDPAAKLASHYPRKQE